MAQWFAFGLRALLLLLWSSRSSPLWCNKHDTRATLATPLPPTPTLAGEGDATHALIQPVFCGKIPLKIHSASLSEQILLFFSTSSTTDHRPTYLQTKHGQVCQMRLWHQNVVGPAGDLHGMCGLQEPVPERTCGQRDRLSRQSRPHEPLLSGDYDASLRPFVSFVFIRFHIFPQFIC